jgi:hypothetical protein
MFLPINYHTSFLIILYLHASVSPSLAQQLMPYHIWVLLYRQLHLNRKASYHSVQELIAFPPAINVIKKPIQTHTCEISYARETLNSDTKGKTYVGGVQKQGIEERA